MIKDCLNGLERDELVCWIAETTTQKFLARLRETEIKLLRLAAAHSVNPNQPEGYLRVQLNKAEALRELIQTLEKVN